MNFEGRYKIYFNMLKSGIFVYVFTQHLHHEKVNFWI